MEQIIKVKHIESASPAEEILVNVEPKELLLVTGGPEVENEPQPPQ